MRCRSVPSGSRAWRHCALCCGRALSLPKGGCFARHDVARGRRVFRAIEPQMEDAGLREQTLDYHAARWPRVLTSLTCELLVLDCRRRWGQHGGGLFGLQQTDDGVVTLFLEEPRLRGERPIDQFAVQQRDLARSAAASSSSVEQASPVRSRRTRARRRSPPRPAPRPRRRATRRRNPSRCRHRSVFHRPAQRGEDVPDVVRGGSLAGEPMGRAPISTHSFAR